MNTVLQILAIGLLVLALLSPVLTGTGRWVNPMTVFNIPQAILLLSYGYCQSNDILSFELSEKALTLLVWGYIAFNVGVMGVVLIFGPISKRKIISQEYNSLHEQLLYWLRPLIWALIVCVAAKYVILLERYPNPFVSVISIRLDYTEGRLNYFFFNNIAFIVSLMLMLNLGILLGIKKNFPKKAFFLAMALVILNDISIGGAYWTFSSMVFLFLAWAITIESTSRFSLRTVAHLVAITSILVLLVYSLMQFRSQGTFTNDLSYLNILLWYAGGDIASFGYFVEYPYPSELTGRLTFGGLYKIVDGIMGLVGHNFLTPLDNQDFVAFIGMSFNTTISFSHYYADFNSVGMVVIAFVVGMISMWFMRRYLARPSLMRLQWLICILYMDFIAIRGVPTEGSYFWILLLAFPTLKAFEKKKKITRRSTSAVLISNVRSLPT